MKRIKDISRISFLLVMILTGLVAYSSTTQAADFKPYEYTFEVSANRSFGGIMGVKDLVITFDSASIASSVVTGSTITVIKVPVKGDTSSGVPLTIVDNYNIDGEKVTISFKNLEYIDYSGKNGIDYQLIIENGGEKYVFPFAIHDVLPGFKSVFLDLSADQINDLVFLQNAPRDILVYIPKYHITKIETIHRNEGVVVGTTGASLTNIDVLTDEVVTRMKVSFNDQPVRDLEKHPSLKGFTMGYAGIKLANAENLREFGVRAYDEFGRFLNTEHFKVNYINNTTVQNQIKISNYITKRAGDFGKTYTLYDLMAKPKVFENILSSLSVNDLNKLGITYANQFSTVNVADLDQLKMAIENSNIKTINLTSDIDLTSDSTLPSGLIIPRDVTINGNATITGNVTLGAGIDVTIKLNNLNINGELKVNVGTGGNVYANNVTTGSTKIESGNMNSIHLNKFTTNGITFNNTSPVRVVLTNSVPPEVNLDDSGEVILEGAYGQVTSTHNDAKLTLKLGSSIARLNINGAKLTVTHPISVTLPDNGGSGELVDMITDETDPGDGDNSVVDLGETSTLEIVQTGEFTIEKDISFSGIDNVALKISSWKVSDPAIFGSGTVSVSGGTISIENLATLSDETIERKVTLLGEFEGKKYKLVVPVKVTK